MPIDASENKNGNTYIRYESERYYTYAVINDSQNLLFITKYIIFDDRLCVDRTAIAKYLFFSCYYATIQQNDLLICLIA